MILKSLRMKGIRSWRDGYIPFSEGFTTIVGPKGAGKSSVISATEFVLFGDEAFRDYSGLMREDSSQSEAILQVEDQGRSLVITRGLVRVKNRISQDSERLKLEVNGTVHTAGKAGDLNRDVGELLRVDDELLEYTCLARQEELKKLLNMDARSRKSVVDSLLGFEAFEVAWKELGEIIARTLFNLKITLCEHILGTTRHITTRYSSNWKSSGLPIKIKRKPSVLFKPISIGPRTNRKRWSYRRRPGSRTYAELQKRWRVRP